MLRLASRWICALGVALLAATPLMAQLPAKLSDAEFWKLVSDFSEPSGYFASENFTSNETAFQTVIPELQRTTKPGGIYLGVGPEQNFTYIANIKPAMVFIIDIRRQNMLQHLIYKALFELYPTRADFVAHLFSRPRPAGLDTNSTVDDLFARIATAPSDTVISRVTYAALIERLVKTHGFTLNAEDTASIRRVFDAFLIAGPLLNYAFTPELGSNYVGRGGRYPTFGELMVQHDGKGTNRNFLASEANYRFLRDLELRNMLVPVVGNFAGPKALRAVGEYLKANKVTVTAFYLSNVEQYLFQDGIWGNFYNNVALLPLDSVSTFIRSIANGRTCPNSQQFVQLNTGFTDNSSAGMRLPSVLASMQETVAAFKAGRVTSYCDVIDLSHQH